MNVAVLRIRAPLRRRRCRLARGSVGEHVAQERRELADIAITAHFGPAVKELGNLPLPIDELKGTATSRLEQTRIDSVIEAAVPRVDIEHDFCAAENGRHVIRSEKAVREPCAQARSGGEFFPPGSEGAHSSITRRRRRLTLRFSSAAPPLPSLRISTRQRSSNRSRSPPW